MRMRHFALRSPTECDGGSPPLGVEKSGVVDFLTLSLYNGAYAPASGSFVACPACEGRGRERAEAAQAVGKSAMSREREDDAERRREHRKGGRFVRSKRAKKRHGDRAFALLV